MTGTRKKPVLITGGCGFIGCNLVDRLALRGDCLLILDNFARPGVRENAHWLKSRHHDSVQIVVGDVRDPVTVTDVVRDARAVIHLASQVAVTSSLKQPVDDFEINARGTLNLLEAVRLHNPESPLVFASTNKVYGRLVEDSAIVRKGRRYVPVDPELAKGVSEATPLDFHSPYGCSKGTADQYVHDYARVFGLRTVVMRMSCIYGPRQFGNEDQGWIAHFLLSAVRGSPLTIYGDGCQVRDALHVADAAAAWIAVLDRIDRTGGRIFNLGGGPENAVSLLELIELTARLVGHEIPYGFADWRPGDQPWYVSDTSALSAAVGWKPIIGLPEGLRTLHSWLEGRFGRPQEEQGAVA